VLVRAFHQGAEGHVLLAGAEEESSALYIAANGCDVTAVSPEVDALERVLIAAHRAGLSERVHGYVSDLASWMPETQLTGVIVSPSALAGLSPSQRARVIELLQSATLDGGFHLVNAIANGKRGLNLDELRTRYEGWMVSVEPAADKSSAFLARKELS